MAEASEAADMWTAGSARFVARIAPDLIHCKVVNRQARPPKPQVNNNIVSGRAYLRLVDMTLDTTAWARGAQSASAKAVVSNAAQACLLTPAWSIVDKFPAFRSAASHQWEARRARIYCHGC